ncbi:MAG: RelA/SpoT family protein [Candidatus Eisenbacteria bacterium]|nr:RelA/SpoT family protein [Candidatus Eisenbacteria bacterium]
MPELKHETIAALREELYGGLAKGRQGTDLRPLRKADQFAEASHRGQRRRSGEPYYTHCLNVALILLELLGRRVDLTILVAALLHDVLEDHPTVERKTLEREFGAEVALLVDGVTKLGGLPFKSPESENSENFRKLLLSMAQDIRVILIKLADRLHNMRTLEYLEPERQTRIARETLEIYAPLAHRLGIARFKWVLEDLAFKFLEPEAYRTIAEKVALRREEREAHVCAIRDPIERRLADAGIRAQVQGRPKSFYSIHTKVQRLGGRFEDLYDLLGLRILVSSRDDCYRVLGILHDAYMPVADRFKDYIATPKTNMYRSLHTTVIGPEGRMVEIQIRTRQMHMEAELGIAAHYRYKEGGRRDEKLERELGDIIIQGTTEWHEDADDPQIFMEFLRASLYQDEVFVFTPKGQLVRLPRGATPVDFAYAIHTEVGNHCAGAKVDNRLVSLRHPLESGDVVEVITSPHAHPREEWLSFAASSRTKAKVRRWLKQQYREDAIDLGRDLLRRELRRRKIRKPREKALDRAAEELGVRDGRLLLAKIGEGDISAEKVAGRFDKRPQPEEAPAQTEVKEAPEPARKAMRGVRIQSVDNLLVRLAKCCRPIAGDDVLGIITRGRGVSVHRVGCPNTFDERVEPERKVQLSWNLNEEQLFHVGLIIRGSERSGLLADVATAVAKEGTNIYKATMGSKDRDARGEFVLEVRNVRQLDRLIRAIRRVKGVTRVDRFAWSPEETGGREGREG